MVRIAMALAALFLQTATPVLAQEVLDADPNLLAPSQDPRRTRDGLREVWVKPMADGGPTLLLWNRGDAPARIAANWSGLGLPATVRLRGRDL